MALANAPKVPDSLRGRRIVGIADMAVSNNPADVIVTYALGSCLGVCVFDPVVRVGGLLHFMLPQSALSPERAAQNPLMFADTGIPSLFLASYALGAKKERILVAVAGGAAFGMGDSEDGIGQRNLTMLRKLLWKNGVMLKRQDVGGAEPRNMMINIASGEVTVSFGGESRVLLERSAP